MNADDFARIFRMICKAHGLPSGPLAQLTNGWKLFPYLFFQNGHQVGIKIMAYQNIATDRDRAAKLVWNHALNSLVSGVGAPTSALGAVGSGVVTMGGKFGGIRPAFGVNMGSVGASTVMRKAISNHDAKGVSTAILGSNHLLKFCVARIDRLGGIGYDVFIFFANSPDVQTNHLEKSIEDGTMDQSLFQRFRVRTDGNVYHCSRPGQPLGMTFVGNFRTRRMA